MSDPDDHHLPPMPAPTIHGWFYAALGRVHYAARRGDHTSAALALLPLNEEQRNRVLDEVKEGTRHLILDGLRDVE